MAFQSSYDLMTSYKVLHRSIMSLPSTHSSWELACAELAYYTIALLPIAYIFYTQGRTALRAWIYLSLYTGLQIAGNAIIAAAGPNGEYSYIGPVLASVGLSPLLIGTAGILHQWFGTTRFFRNSYPGLSKRVQIISIVFHVGATMSIALIAAGGSMAAQSDPPSYALTLLRIGAIVLFAMFLILCGMTVWLSFKYMRDSSKALIWAVIISLPALAVRYVYELFSSFSSNLDFNPIYGRLVFRVVLEVVPQAFVLLVLIVGAIVHTEDEIKHDVLIDRTATIPLRDTDEEEGRAVARAQEPRSSLQLRAAQRSTSTASTPSHRSNIRHSLANVKLVCKQIRDELSEEILNAKKTKATGLLVDTKKAEDTRYVGTFRTETIKFPNPRRDPAVLEGFAEVTFAMPFITWEHYPEHDDPFWSENGLPYRSDYYESVGGYDFWLGRFKYTKHISDQGATTWTLDGVKGDLLCDPEYSKIDVVAHESKLAAVKEQVVTKVVEKQDDDSPLERVISKLQAPFHLMAGTYLEDLKFDLVSGIDTFNKVEQYEKEGYRPSYYKVLCQLESRNDMPKRTDDAEICDSAVKATYYL
ncbi:hypothetical protein HII31_03525, partial [Pseudocercospora fuligena]